MSMAWSVDALLDAFLSQPADQRLLKHVVVKPEAAERVHTNAWAPVGTVFARPRIVLEDSDGNSIDHTIFTNALSDGERSTVDLPDVASETGAVSRTASQNSGAPATPGASGKYDSTTQKFFFKNQAKIPVGIKVTASKNNFIEWVNSPSGVKGFKGNVDSVIVKEGELSIDAGKNFTMDFKSKVDAMDGKSLDRFVDADVILDLAVLKAYQVTNGVANEQSFAEGQQMHLLDLTDGTRDNVLDMLKTAAGQSGRIMKIYNPRHLDIQIVGASARKFKKSVDGDITTIELLPQAAGTYSAEIEIREAPSTPAKRYAKLNPEPITIEAEVVPRQELSVNYTELKKRLQDYMTQLLAWNEVYCQ